MADAIRRMSSAWSDTPGQLDLLLAGPARGCGPGSPRSPGRRRGSRRVGREPARGAAAIAAGDRRDALLRDVPPRGDHQRRLGLAGRLVRDTRLGPGIAGVLAGEPRDRSAVAVLAQALLGEPGEGEAPVGKPQAEALDREADPAGDGAQVGAPVVAAPDLVPVDDQAARTSARARGPAWRRSRGSTGRRRCGRRRSVARGGADARTRRARSGAGARSAAGRSPCRDRSPGRRPASRTGSPAPSSSHWRRVR